MLDCARAMLPTRKALSVAVSMTWGISALMLAAIPVYLVVGWVYPPGAVTPAPAPP